MIKNTIKQSVQTIFSRLKSMKAVKLIFPVFFGSNFLMTNCIYYSEIFSLSYAAKSNKSYSFKYPFEALSISPKTLFRSSLVSRS